MAWRAVEQASFNSLSTALLLDLLLPLFTITHVDTKQQPNVSLLSLLTPDLSTPQWLENCRKTFGDKDGGQGPNTHAQVELHADWFKSTRCVSFVSNTTLADFESKRICPRLFSCIQVAVCFTAAVEGFVCN